MKTYILIFEDKNKNELKRQEIEARNIVMARQQRNIIFANCMIKDCYKISISLKK